jgi:hypothetical protein
MTDPAQNPAVIEVTGEITSLQAFAASYAVTTPAQYEAGAEDLKRVKAAQKKLEETRTSITGPMNEALKKVNAFFKKPAEALDTIERKIKGALGSFYEEQQRKAREEQVRADEAARKERARIGAQARKAAESGKTEKAAQLDQRAAAVVAPVITREAPKVAGLQMREVWEFTIVDASKIPAAFLMPDEKKIGQLVRNLKGDAAAILGDGVKVTSRMAPASSAA